MKQFNKYQSATVIAIIFHAVGLLGIFYGNREFFVRLTPYNLLLMFALLVWTAGAGKQFILFSLLIFLLGYLAEWVGVNTGYLFGDYHYGDALGYQLEKVPLIIGINWIIVIYCSGIFIHTLLMRAIKRISSTTGEAPMRLKALSVIIDGATLAVFFDWIMEPVAIKLGFWQWQGGDDVPMFNYACWFLVSLPMLALFHFSGFGKSNKFAIHLLMIQMMFFLLLRAFL